MNNRPEVLSYQMRPATADDLNFLYGVVRVTMREHVVAVWGSWDEEYQANRFAERFNPQSWQVIIVDGVPAGGIATEQRPDELFLANLHLLTDYQGRGIGTALVQSLQTSAVVHGLPLTLNVLRSNIGAKQLYERLGFRVVQDEEERWCMEWTEADSSESHKHRAINYSTFLWSGSETPFLDAPNVARCGPVVVGRYGGATASGAYKNEDAALAWAADDGIWTFVALLDAHGSSESADLVLDRVAALQAEVVNFLESAGNGDELPLSDLTTLLQRHLSDDDFRRACARVRGETALLLVAQRGAYLWWLSVGDIPVYVLHPEFARLGQFALNQRMFYEWIGQVNTFALPNPCFATGGRQLRLGTSRIVMTTDGLLEFGTRPFENPVTLSDTFAAGRTEDRSVEDAVREALERVHAEKGRDSATVLAWEIRLPESDDTMQPSA